MCDFFVEKCVFFWRSGFFLDSLSILQGNYQLAEKVNFSAKKFI